MREVEAVSDAIGIFLTGFMAGMAVTAPYVFWRIDCADQKLERLAEARRRAERDAMWKVPMKPQEKP